MSPNGPIPPSPRARTRLFRFGAVGATGVVVNLGLLVLLVRGLGLHYSLASLVAIEASILTNYAGNRFWTWRDRKSPWESLLHFHGVALVGMGIQWATLVACVEGLGLHYLAGSLLGIVGGTAWNFFGHHHITFAHASSPLRARLARPVLYLVAFFLQALLAAYVTHHWDTWVFQSSVRDFLSHGTTPYQTAEAAPAYIWTGTSATGQAMWYAYPPLPLLLMAATYWPAALGFVDAPTLGRLLIKLPFLAGNLLLAWTAHRWVATGSGPDRANRARRLERFLLFNPLLVMIASFWGMFEALLAAFLVLSFLALRAGRLPQAGAWWGAAALLKIFPLFAAPVLAVHLARRYGRWAALRYFGIGAAVFATVSLPFLLLTPQGFLQQVLLAHGGRPPGRFGPIGASFSVLVWLDDALGSHPLPLSGLVAAFSLFSFAATALALFLIALSSRLRPPTDRSLLFFVAASFTLGLFFTKTISEQYLVLPLVFFALYLADRSEVPLLAESAARRIVVAFSTLVPLAGLLANAHFLLFLPPDVARVLFGTDVATVYDHVAAAFHLAPRILSGLLFTAAQLLVAAAFLTAFPLVRPALAAGWKTLVTPRAASGRRGHPWATPAAVLLLGLLLVLPSLVVGAWVATQTPRPEPVRPAQGRLAGLYYDLSWRNPAYDPTVRYGDWDLATLLPLDGYYTLTAHRLGSDLDQIRDLGFDYVLAPFQADRYVNAKSLALAASQHGMPFAFQFDLEAAARHASPAGAPPGVSPVMEEALRQTVAHPIPGYWTHPALLRVGPDQRVAIFLSHVDQVAPRFDEAERAYVAQLRWQMDPRHDPRMDWTLTLEAYYEAQAPQTAAELAHHPDPLWRAAYEQAERRLWRAALESLDPHERYVVFADASLSTAFWSAVPVGVDLEEGPHVPSARAALDRWGQTFSDPLPWSQESDGTSLPLLVPAYDEHWARPTAILHPAVHDGRLLWDESWTRVLKDPTTDHVLVYAWNAFAQGAALEPTVEYGDVLLARTALWLTAWHEGSPTPPAPWDPRTEPLPPPLESLEGKTPLGSLLGLLVAQARRS